MKRIINILLAVLLFGTVSGQTLDSRMLAFGNGAGYASVLRQINGVSLTGKTPLYEGDTASLKLQINGLSGVAYEIKWYKDNTLLAGSDDSLRIEPVFQADVGDYWCTVKDLYTGTLCYSDTLSLVVVKNGPVAENITLSQRARNLCEGAGDTVRVLSYMINTDHCSEAAKAKIAAKAYTLSYQWKKDGQAIGATGKELILNHLTAADAGVYTCELTITANDGTFEAQGLSQTCRIDVWKIPDLVLVPEGTAGVIFGHSLTLKASGAASYQWSTGSRDSVLRVSPVSPTTYSVKGFNAAGCYTEKSVTVDVMELQLNVGDDRVIFKGESVALDIQTNADSVIWYEPVSGGASRRLGTGLTMTVAPAATTTYELYVWYQGVRSVVPLTVTVKDNYAGGIEDGFAQTCVPPRIVDQLNQTTEQTCELVDVSLWLKPEGTDLQLEWQIYDRELGEFVRFNGADNVKGLGQNRLQFDSFTEDNDGIYRCRVFNGCGEVVSDSFSLNHALAPEIVGPLNGHQTLCQDPGHTFSLGVRVLPARGIDYQWYKSVTRDGAFTPFGENQNYTKIEQVPASDGIYKVVAANACGKDSSMIDISVITPPSIDSISLDVNVCTGSDATFFVQIKSKGSFNYSLREVDRYDPETELGRWDGSPVVTVPNVTENGLFYWHIENAGKYCGETKSEYMNLRVDYPLEWQQDIDIRDTLICSGHHDRPVVAPTVKRNVSDITYTWYHNGVVEPAHTHNYLLFDNLQQKDAGNWMVVAKNKCPQLVSSTFQLRVNETPRILSSPQVGSTYCQGRPLDLRVVASDQYEVDSVRWFLNDYKLVDGRHNTKGAGTAHLRVDSMTNANAGVYRVYLYNICGSSVTEPATVEMVPVPRIDFGLDQYRSPLCPESVLSIKASGPDLRYEWLFESDPIYNEFGEVAASAMTANLKLSDIPRWDKSGTYTCHVQNSCGDELSKATLVFSTTDSFRFIGGGTYCQGGAGVDAQLVGTNPRVYYSLYEKNRGYADQTYSGRDAAVSGGPLVFSRLKAGEYYVMAMDTLDCKMIMPGTVTVTEDPWPKKFRSFIARPACGEGSNGDIGLEGSEKYIEYYALRKNEEGRWDTLPHVYLGTGGPISLTYLPAGVYKVLARNPLSMCEVGMDEILDMKERILVNKGKLTAVDMDSIHCVGAVSDVKLLYDHFEPGCTYTLKRNGILTDKVRDIPPVLFEEVEAGLYTVTITDPAGCQLDAGRIRVLAQPAPLVFNLTGDGGVYCIDDTHPRELALDNSEAGVTYTVYRKVNEFNTARMLDTLSRWGGALNLQVPAEEGEYYVVATDATPKHCSIRMNGSMTLSRSKLEIVLPADGVFRVKEMEQAHLNITINNAVGTCKVFWRDPDSLTTPYNQQNVVTKPVMNPMTLFVTATDDLGCSVEEKVRVEPYGCAFKGGLLNAQGEAATYERICRGDAVYLNTWWECGGGITEAWWGWHWVEYQYYSDRYHGWLTGHRWEWGYHSWFVPYRTHFRWYDDTGRLNSDDFFASNGRYMSSISYKKKESGWVYCDIINGPETVTPLHRNYWWWQHYSILHEDPVITRTYKVWVEVQESPKEFIVDDAGYREIVLNSDEEITLHQSDNRVLYRLEYNDGRNGFQPVKDQEQYGNGGALSFVIPGNHMQWGVYRIMGKLVNSGDLGLTCWREMEGRVEIQQRGIKDRLEMERPLCTGDTTADLRITSSSKDAVYFICRQNGHKLDTLETWYRGTGAAIIVKDVKPGTYQAIIRIDGVDNALSGVVEVKEQPLPDLCAAGFVDNDSVYCWGTPSEVALNLDNSCYQLGYTYSLYKNGTDTKETRRTSPVVWNGLLDGEYQVKITNEMGCSVYTPVRTVLEKDPPVQFQLIGDPTPFCEDREEGTRNLTMSSTQAGVLYSFRTREGKDLLDTIGDGGPISLDVPLVDGTYYVVATDTLTQCSREMPNDVFIGKSRLAVTADRSIVTTVCGKPAQLRITIANATPPVQIEWSNELKLAAGQKNVQNPYTIPLNGESVRYNVTVTDAKGCVRTTEVLAECVRNEEGDPTPLPVPPDPPGTGGTLTANIANGTCSYLLGDKIRIERGNSVNLCASVAGGLGAYSYYWWTDDRDPLCTYKAFSWKKLSNGYIYLKVTTPDGQQATDRIFVEIIDKVVDDNTDTLPPGHGGELLAQIRQGDCQTVVGDTIHTNQNLALSLCAFASGGWGKYSFRWSDRNGLISEARKFREWRPSESTLLELQVIDTAGNTAIDQVYVKVDDEELLPPDPPDFDWEPCPDPPAVPKTLRVAVMDAYCNYDVDTVELCQNKTLSLCASAVGGCGGYEVRWFDDVHTLGITRGLRYKKPESGYVYLEIMSVGDGQLAYDTVFVNVGRTPLRQRIEEPGLRCILPGDSTDIRLDGSEIGAEYTLWYSMSNVTVDSVTTLAGTGEALSFHLDTVRWGYYTVSARFIDEHSCESQMMESVEIRRRPQVFRFGGEWEYCDGSPIEGTIALDSSEAAATYRLFRSNTLVSTQDGTGNPIDFTGKYTAGKYYIDATIGQCTMEMEGEANVRLIPKPLLGSAVPKGILCAYDGPYEISIPNSQRGHIYYLTREVGGADAGRWEGNGTIPGGISFGSHQDVGIYTIWAENTEKGCTFSYPGPEIRRSDPPAVRLEYSDCTSDPLGTLTLVDVDTTMEYWMTYDGGAQTQIGIYAGDVVLHDLRFGQYCVTVKDPETNCATEPDCRFLTKLVSGWVDTVAWLCTGADIVELRVHDPEYGAKYTVNYAYEGLEDWVVDSCDYRDPVFRFKPSADYYLFRKSGTPVGDLVCQDQSVFDIVKKQSPNWYETFPADGTEYRMCLLDSCEVRLTDWDSNVTYTLEYTGEGVTNKFIKRIGTHIPREIIGYDVRYVKAPIDIPCKGSFGQDSMIYVRPYLTGYYDSWGYYHSYWVYWQYVSIPIFQKPKVFNPYTKEGWYRITADNGCVTEISRFRIVKVPDPLDRQLYGDDKCIKYGQDSLTIYLSGRDQNISYYLYRGDELVDSIDFRAPDSIHTFKPQSEVGCYYAWARTNSPTCQRRLERSVCMSMPPQVYAIEEDKKVVMVCREGVSVPVYMSNTDIGVRYVLTRDYEEVGEPVEGTGDRMLVGYADTVGLYGVVAKVGTCVETMEGTLWLKPGEAPVYSIDSVLRYCEGSGGVEIVMKAPTSDTISYNLLDEAGLSLTGEQRGNRDGEAFAFIGRFNQPELTLVVKNLTSQCTDTVPLTLVEDSLPKVFPLLNANNGYLCPDDSTEMYLEGSEDNILYTLYDNVSGMTMAQRPGTGEKLSFGKVVDRLGDYYVIAEVLANRECRRNMADTIHLQPAPEIRDFKVQTLQKYYCFTEDSSGRVGLPGSESGVNYELFKNGVPTGRIRPGNGRELDWSNLLGKSCSLIKPEEETPDEYGRTDGYYYTVRATHALSGCHRMMSGEGTIIEEMPPSILVYYPDNEQEICEGEMLTMNVSLASGCNLRYQLMKDGAEIFRDTVPVFTIETLSSGDYGLYQWRAFNDCGVDSTKKAIEVVPRERLRLVRPMQDVSLCGVENEQLILQQGFDYPLVVQWYKLGDTTVLSTGDVLLLSGVEDVGTYVCKAWNECNIDAPLTDTVVVSFGLPTLDISREMDTVCRGDDFSYVLNTKHRVKWYLNGEDLHNSAKVLTLNNIQPEDEGLYGVTLTNNCGTTDLIPVLQLWVDDTIQVLDITGDSVMCLGESAELFIKTRPEDRVKYAWFHEDTLVSTSTHYLAGPFTKRTSLSYTVYYTNACRDKQKVKSKTVHLKVPKEIVYQDPAAQISFCADCVTDTVLRLHTDPATFARYEWFCRKNAMDAERILQDSQADTLAIRMCSRNSGFYYCRIYNRCETKTVQTFWVKVDSVPQIVGNWPKFDTICDGAPHTFELQTTGGNMTYRINFLYRDGRHAWEEYPYTSFESSCKYVFPKVTEKLDGCRVWWEVYNSCGDAVSDTTLLNVRPAPRLVVSPRDTLVCFGEKVPLRVELKNGATPWEYGYKLNGEGELFLVQDRPDKRDTLWADTAADYEFTYMKDRYGCSFPDFKEVASVRIRPQVKLHLSAPEKVCARDTIELGLTFENQGGPWELTLVEYSERTNALNEYPLVITQDTVMRFIYRLKDTLRYYVKENTFFANNGGDMICEADPGDEVKVIVNSGAFVSWDVVSEANRHLPAGSCRVTDLFDLFHPDSTGGYFQLTDTLRKKTWKVPGGVLSTDSTGMYRVEYIYTSDNGCPANMSPQSQNVWIDTLPSVSIDLQNENICAESGQTVMDFLFTGRPPFVYNYEVRPYDNDNRAMVVNYQTGKRTSNRKVRHILDGQPNISKVIYKITSVKDEHGCFWNGAPLSDTLYMRPGCEYNIYPHDGEDFVMTSSPVYFAEGDSVAVLFELVKGQEPWNVVCADIYNQYLWDTTFQKRRDTLYFKEAGYYAFSVRDSFRCTTNETGFELAMLGKGYLRLKVMLEGPYDPQTQVMKSNILDKLPHFGMSTLPLDMIDWIYLELRDDPEKAPVQVDTCILHADGSVTDKNGSIMIAFPGAYDPNGLKKYHVVIRQRNHLPVMTKEVELGPNAVSPLFLDLTDETEAKRYLYVKEGTLEKNHMSKVGKVTGPWIWALSAGETSGNGTITVYDANEIAEKMQQSGTLTYELLLYDLNFNGVIEWSVEGNAASRLDWLKARNNRTNDKFTEVPVVE